MIVVNFFGSPGAGKSTGAAYVFSKLKTEGINVELVTEAAKDKVWEEDMVALSNQAYIFGEQYLRLSRLEGKVDVVVTDSPLLLSAFYNQDGDAMAEYDKLITKIFNRYNNYNVYVENDDHYNPIGRLQTENEANSMRQIMKDFLVCHGVKYKEYNGNSVGFERIASDVLKFVK